MRTPLLYLALGVSLAGCTGDDTGETDTDIGTDTDTEVGTEADTEIDTEVAAFCGDGTVDPDEECDDGDANGDDPANCSEDCEWNGFVTCDLVSGDVMALDTSLSQPDGTYHIAARFSGTTALTSTCAPDSTQDAVVTFDLPAAGTWAVSTSHPGTTVATALSLRTDCDERTEIQCASGNGERANGAKTLIIDGEQGDSFAVVVHNLGADGGSWQLSIDPVTGVAGLGETCSNDVVCSDGLCSDDVCVQDTAPTLDTASIVQTGTFDYQVTLTGTDPNRDVTHVQVPTFDDILGDTWGDDEDEAVLTTDSTIVFDGDDFTATTDVRSTFPSTGLGDILSADFQVLDAAGNTSSTVTVTWPTPAVNETQDYIDDACDMCVDCTGNDSGFPRSCNPNAHDDPNDPTANEIPALYCVWDDLEGTGASCEDRNTNTGPIAGEGAMFWQGDQAVLSFSGYDNAHSTGIHVNITAVYDNGETVSLGQEFTSVTWDIGNFQGEVDFDTEAIDGTVDHLEVQLEDNTSGGDSEADTVLIVDWVEPVEPSVSALGEECDLRGWDSVCEDPYVCSPSLSGIPACADSVAPVLIDLDGTYQGGRFASFQFSFEAEDVNADWDALMIETAAFRPNALDKSSWMTDPFGQTIISTSTSVGFADWMYRVHVRDADGNESNSSVVVGVETDLVAGDTCNTGVCSFFGCSAPTQYCDVNGGMTCSNREELAGIVRECEINTAPTLDSLVVRRTGTSTFNVEFSGGDANGDAASLLASLDEDGVVTPISASVDFTAPINGVTTFTSNFNGTLTTPSADAMVDVTVKDWAFATSSTLTAAIPPLRLAGEECSGDDTIDRCQDGSECLDGSCFAFEPSLSDAVIRFNDTGRDGIVTVTGSDDLTDADTQLREVDITIGGQTWTSTLSRNAIDWDGNDFTFDVAIAGLGTGPLVDQNFMTVTVRDVGGFTDTETYFITPQRTIFDDCDDDDTDGLDNMCHAGLVCETGMCMVDMVDPCAGIPLTVVGDGETTVQVTTASGTGTRLDEYPDYATCGSDANRPNGREAAIEYTATQSGDLTITSSDDPNDGSVIHAYLFVRFDECVTYDSVAECDNSDVGGNSITMPVNAGDVLYIMVDGGTFPAGGPVNVSFSY